MIDLFVDSDERQSDREIETGSALANVGRRQVYQQTARRIRKSRVENRRPYTFPGLPERPIGQADDREGRRPGRAVGFDADDVAFNAEHPG